MMNAIAIDDEPLALELIETFSQRLDFLKFEKGFSKTSEGLQYLDKNPVDLIFLDIQMPAMSGINLYKRIRYQPMLIFTTSYSEYALESYELNAIDYLLKPFTPSRFEAAVLKAKNKYELERHALSSDTEKFLVLKADYGLIKIAMAKILYVEGLDNNLKIYLEAQSPVVVRLTLKALMEKLGEKEFIRVHRSYIVPINRIETMKQKLIIVAGQIIPVGINYEDNLKAMLNRYT
jgi:DNA-binding LytR/AlgR family response regulator